jgi:hypothetical protein
MTEKYPDRIRRADISTYIADPCPSCGGRQDVNFGPSGDLSDDDSRQWVTPNMKCRNPSCDRYDDGTHL